MEISVIKNNYKILESENLNNVDKIDEFEMEIVNLINSKVF